MAFLSLSKQIAEQYPKLGQIPSKSLFTSIQTCDATDSAGLLTESLRKLQINKHYRGYTCRYFSFFILA
jgi:hypothetical protein